MNINGIYGNGADKVLDKKVNNSLDVVQKDLESITKETHYLASINNVVDTDHITYEERIIKETEKTSKVAEEEVEEKDQWKNNADRMSEDDYKDLSEEGITLEDFNIERLDRALIRIKSQRSMKEVDLEGQKEQIKVKSEAIKNMANGNGATKKIIEKLIEADLPVTEQNIARIANAIEMATTATQMSDRAMNYLIKNNLEPTIENIYKAQFSGNYTDKRSVSEETWNALQGQVTEVISSAGLEVNEENKEAAKWLLNQNLPLTGDNLGALHDLKLIKNGIVEDETLKRTMSAFIAGSPPTSASLGFAEVERVEQTILALQNISDEAIDLALYTKQSQQSGLESPINCSDLQHAQKLLDGQKVLEGLEQQNSKSLSEINKQAPNDTPQDIDIQTITARRQLEEIRLKMTLDAGQQLIKKGFNLETDGLSKIIDGLKEIEDQYYNNLLKEGKTSVSNENLQTLKESLQGVEILKTMPNYILGSTLASRKIETVNGLLEAGNECKQTLEKVKEAYEVLMTSPRSDMGDSISKAFRNVDAILEDLKMEATQANERAVKILGYNQIEITEENIQQIKSYDEQVNHLMKNLHPSITVELIKKGVNPLNIPIDELNQKIDEIKSEIGVSEEEKYSKYLWKLEKEHGISEEEKKSYIGIYRLLNAVEKTDGAALGAVIKADQDVTMKNLLTAVRTIKSGGINASVDNTFGALEQLTFTRESITKQVDAAFHPGSEANDLTQNENITSSMEDKLGYVSSLLQNVMEQITPNKLQAMGNTEEIMNMSVEKLQDNLLNSSEKDVSEHAYWSEKQKVYQDVTQQADNAMKLLKDYEIPSSIHNIQAANDILSTDQSFFKQWKNLLEKERNDSSKVIEPNQECVLSDVSTMSERLINSLESPKSMIEQYESIEQDVNKTLNQAYENPFISSQDITTLQRISNGMSFLQKLAKRESYEIPITIGDRVTNVNVTIIKNTEETGKVDINITSETLGKVSCKFSMKEQGLKGLIICDNRIGLEVIQSASEELKEEITQNGLEVKQIHYGIENKTTDRYQFKTPNTSQETERDSIEVKKTASTETLYTLAKSVLIHIRAIESKYMQTE